MPRLNAIRAFVTFFVLLMPATPLWAEDYPSRPIRILAGAAPGGLIDLFARTFAQRLQERSGQPAVVENNSVATGTIGAVLWRAGQHVHTRTPVRNYLPVALIKLLVHPLVVWSVAMLGQRAGAPVPSFGLMVMVLAAALPSASNVSLLAERYGADNGRIARIVMASTVLAFATFSMLAWLLRGGH